MTSIGHAESKIRPLADQLGSIRNRITELEQGIVDDLHTQKNIQIQVKKIQTLLKFQKLEKKLGMQRLAELEHTVVELESRRKSLTEKIDFHHKTIRKCLMAIEASNREGSSNPFPMGHLADQEKLVAPRRRVLSNLVDRGFKEIETLRADLTDAMQLGARIQDEKQQLAYLFQDLKEQESVLELNRQLQIDFLKKKRNERIAQLENYRNLKSSELQVEHLIKDFNARLELEHEEETEKVASKAMAQGGFSKLKGKLPFPVLGGKVISAFGRSFDSRSGLFIFKKGVDIEATKDQPVQAISAGRVAFSGELPNYGRVVIIDHGDHFYSLCAHLGKITKNTNESVAVGDAIGLTDNSGTPLYFEIRARNVAVNPLQWVFN